MLLVLSAVAEAQSGVEVLRQFAGEPGVRELQRAAARLAAVEPERVRSWLRRARVAALLPGFRARVGRGIGGVAYTRGADGLDHFSTVESDAWRFELEASWALDRLVFDPDEMRISREAQRVAARREQLLTEIAQLYYTRRRLQVDQLLDSGGRAELILDRQLAIEELTAVLDGLTDGALTRGGRY
jgi:hypothetical protein